MSAALVKDSVKPNRRGDGGNREDKQMLHERPPGLSGYPSTASKGRQKGRDGPGETLVVDERDTGSADGVGQARCGPTGFLWDSGKTKSVNRNLVISVQLGIKTLGNKIPPGVWGGKAAEGMVQGSWAVAPRTRRESCQRGVEAFREERC